MAYDRDVGQAPPLSGSQLVTNINEELVGLYNDIQSNIRSKVVLGTDRTNNNATPNTMQDITGLAFPVVSGGRYWFRFHITYTAAATTTGARFSVNGPTLGADGIDFRSEYPLTATTRTLNDGLAAYDAPAAANATSLTASNIAIVEGIIHAGAAGDVIARFASEVAGSAIVAKANKSFVEYRRLD